MQKPKDIVRELAEDLRRNNVLRQRLGIHGAVDQLDAPNDDTLAWKDNEGGMWFAKVEQG